jgi:hypothetical protein
MIQRWLQLAGQETDQQRRGDLSMAKVFAELVNRQDVWRKALEGWNMKESAIIKEIVNETKAEMVLHALEKRLKSVPEDLRSAILAVQDSQRLDELHDLALESRSLHRFRQEANL